MKKKAQQYLQLLFSFILFTVLTVPCWADDHPGEVELQASAYRDAQTDLMSVQMATEFDQNDPALLAKKINETMAWALDQAKKFPDVTVEGGSYSTRPVYKKQTLSHWRGSQVMVLKSSDVAKLSSLVTLLQTRLTMKSVDYTLSEKKREQVENSLIGEAIKRFEQRALLIQKSLNANNYRLLKLNISSRNRLPQPIRPMAVQNMRSADVSPPVQLTSGIQRVTVDVRGSIVLMPN